MPSTLIEVSISSRGNLRIVAELPGPMYVAAARSRSRCVPTCWSAMPFTRLGSPGLEIGVQLGPQRVGAPASINLTASTVPDFDCRSIRHFERRKHDVTFDRGEEADDDSAADDHAQHDMMSTATPTAAGQVSPACSARSRKGRYTCSAQNSPTPPDNRSCKPGPFASQSAAVTGLRDFGLREMRRQDPAVIR